MGVARFGLQGSFFVLAFAVLSGVSSAANYDSAVSGAYSVRDVRTQTRTHWDYQPGQGPHKPLRDRPSCPECTPNKVTEPLQPPPPIQEGDWRNPPSAEMSLPPVTASIEPKTESTLDFGFQASYLRYREKASDNMKNNGGLYGAGLAYNGALGSNWFTRLEARAVAGPTDFKMDGGTKKEVTTILTEARAAVGWDLMFGRFGVSPYVGVGYRFLQTDIESTMTGSSRTMTRQGQYLFFPIGLEPRLRLPNGDRIVLTAEYDPILRGWQKSYYGDLSDIYPDIQNQQKSGYGLRGELSYQTERFVFGPFFNYWNLKNSSTDCDAGSTGQLLCASVPHNTSVEYGVNFRYRFRP